MLRIQSPKNHRIRYHRYWLCLHHTVILISNARISVSMKVTWISWPSALTVFTTAFENQLDWNVKISMIFCRLEFTKFYLHSGLNVGNVDGLKGYQIFCTNLIAINLAHISSFLNLISKFKVLTKGFSKMYHLLIVISFAVMTNYAFFQLHTKLFRKW